MWPKTPTSQHEVACLTTRGSVSQNTGQPISKHAVAYLGSWREGRKTKKSIEKIEFPAFFEPQMRVTLHRFFSDYYHTTQDTPDLATDKV